MQLTTKGRYAVTAMLDLASNESTRPVTLDMISQRQNISLSYLEQLFAKLKKRHSLKVSEALAAAIYSMSMQKRSP